MPAQWTGEFLSKMHVNGITAKEFSGYIGYNSKYVSAVLNGKRRPQKAELLFNTALEELIKRKRKEN